ncbi:RNA polymerase sigma factor [Dactylosporangium sp. CS-033363]|uniref:RNA polymerase sigma factor n=1 Tax=Dactylosporangium sp. CS-033363 TaxID=3239935 RepID=UPI003D8C1788
MDPLERLVRDEGAVVLATLVRATGSLDLAEDATQDALEKALVTWPVSGVPDNPRAWLIVAARHRAIDIMRREAQRPVKEALFDAFGFSDRDDLLSLIFMCCHPALSVDAQVALALRTLGGLGTADVARALLVPEPTVAKRLTRAKQKIQQARIPYRVPPDHDLPARLTAVAATVYLIFNEGYTNGSRMLVDEAVRLARLLVRLMPDEPTALGLLALLLLQDSRRDARLSPAGELILLADQDRSRWHQALIREGVIVLGTALRRSPDRPDRYAVQAAVAACHALAPTWAETPWDAVVSWYDVLLTVHDTPVVRLNRAAAVAERDGPGAALPLVDALPLETYPWWHATRGELLLRLGRSAEAAAAFEAALALDLPSPARIRVISAARQARAASCSHEPHRPGLDR